MYGKIRSTMRYPKPLYFPKEAPVLLEPRELVRNRKKAADRRTVLAEGYVSADSLAVAIEAYGGSCAYCDGAFEFFDHVVPISRGGKHSAENILPTCRKCNSAKGNRTLAEWMLQTWGRYLVGRHLLVQS